MAWDPPPRFAATAISWHPSGRPNQAGSPLLKDAPVTESKRRQPRRRRAAKGGRRHSRNHRGTGPVAARSQPNIPSYRPRDELSPVNGVDSIDRHISRATETEDSLDRYLTLLRFFRSTVLQLAVLLLLGCLTFGAGVGAAIVMAGLRPVVAVVIGAGGSTAFGLTAVIRLRTWLKSGLRMLAMREGPSQLSEQEAGGGVTDPGTAQ